MAQTLLKDEVHRLIDSLPEDATWDDFKYAMYVREQVELGRNSAREEPLLTTDEVFAEFHLEAGDWSPMVREGKSGPARDPSATASLL